MSDADEFAAQIKHMSRQDSNDRRTIVYGHLSSYDAKTGRARFIIPSFTDDGTDYALTSWAPLATGFTGAGGWGLQLAPIGGATKENPTGGEPCVLHLSETNYGVVVGGHLIANEVNTPPNPTLAAGEVRLKSQTGATVDMTKTGNMKMSTTGGGIVELRNSPDPVIYMLPPDGKNVYLGGDGTKGSYDYVVTMSGPSINVKARFA